MASRRPGSRSRVRRTVKKVKVTTRRPTKVRKAKRPVTKRTFRKPTPKRRVVTRRPTTTRRPTPRRAPRKPTPKRRPSPRKVTTRRAPSRGRARRAAAARVVVQKRAARKVATARRVAADVRARKAGFRSAGEQSQVKARNLARAKRTREQSAKLTASRARTAKLLAQRAVQLRARDAKRAAKEAKKRAKRGVRAPTRRVIPQPTLAPTVRRVPTPRPPTKRPSPRKAPTKRPTRVRVPAPPPIISAIPQPPPRPKPTTVRVPAPPIQISAAPKPAPTRRAPTKRPPRPRGVQPKSLVSTPAVEVPSQPVDAGIPSFIPQAAAQRAPTKRFQSVSGQVRPATAPVSIEQVRQIQKQPSNVFEPVIAKQSQVGSPEPFARAGEPAIGPVVPGTGGKVNVVRSSGKISLVSPSTAKKLASRGALATDFEFTQETQRGGVTPRDVPLRDVPLVSPTKGELKKEKQIRDETLATRRGDAPFLTRSDIATQRVLGGVTFGPGESIEGITGTQVEKDVIARTRREQDVAAVANALQAQRFSRITEAKSGIEVLSRQRELEAKGQQQIIEPQFTFGAGFAEDRGLARVGGVVTKAQQDEIARRLRETPEPSLRETLGFGVPSETIITRIQPKERSVPETGTEQKLISLGFDPTTQNIDRGIIPVSSLASVPTPLQTFDQRTVGPVQQNLGIESTIVPVPAKGRRGRGVQTAFNTGLTRPDVASPFSRISSGFTQSLQNELIGIENIGRLATGRETKEFFPTPSQRFIAAPIESGIQAARGEIPDFRADLERKGQALGADVVNDPFFAFGDILAQGAVTVATLGVGKGILTALRIGGITARAASVTGKAARGVQQSGTQPIGTIPRAGVIGARAGTVQKPRVTQQFVDPLTKNVVEIPDPSILSRTLKATSEFPTVRSGFEPTVGLSIGRVGGFVKRGGKIVRRKVQQEPSPGREFFAGRFAPRGTSGILSPTTRLRTLPRIQEVLPAAGTLARRIPKGIPTPVARISTPADIATQTRLTGLIKGARRGGVTAKGKGKPKPPTAPSVLAPPKGVTQSPLFRIRSPERFGDVTRAAGRGRGIPEPTGLGGVVRAGTTRAARGPRVTRNILGVTPRAGARVSAFGGRAGARQVLLQVPKQVTRKGARTAPRAISGIDDLAKVTTISSRALRISGAGTRAARATRAGTRTTQVALQVPRTLGRGQRAIGGFGRTARAGGVAAIPLGISVPALVQPARAQTVGILQPFTEQREKRRTGIVSILQTRQTQFPTRATRESFSNRLFSPETGRRTPRLATALPPTIRGAQTFQFPGFTPTALGREGPRVRARREDQGGDFFGRSRKQRRFFRVFDVGRDKKGRPIPFGRVSRGLGVQVQSDAPIFEVEDVLGQRRKRPSQESFFDLNI